jgi:hypothetical protein
LQQNPRFFQHTTDVWTFLTDEEGLGILVKHLLSSWRIRIATTGKEVFNETFCISPDFTSYGVPCDFVALD